MNNKKTSFGKKALGVGVLALAGIGLVAAATENTSPQKLHDNADVQAAIESGDYNAFVDAVSTIDPDVATHVTQERFEQMVQRHDLKTAVDEAIENEDYSAWVAAVSALPHGEDIADVVTEDEFPKLIELHELREQAKELAQEIGLPEREQHRGPPGMHDEKGQERKGPFGQIQGQDQNQQRVPQSQWNRNEMQHDIGSNEQGPTQNHSRQGGFFGWFR